jgi:ABC-type glycerol-3-phosphate transport system permease component
MKNKIKQNIGKIIFYCVLFIFAIMTAAPFLYMIGTSFKGQSFIFEYPPKFIPDQPTLRNYIVAWTSRRFDKFFLNSLFVTICSTVSVVFISSLMAYGFSRFRFKLKGILFGSIRVFMMMPAMTLIIPQFIMATKLHLINSLTGVILVYIAQNIPLCVFLLTGFMQQLPRELEEAAQIDGATPWNIYRSIIMPLSKPALATVTIFSALGAWDEYVWALTILNDPEKRTLPVGIAAFHGQYLTDWGVVFAASLIAITPIILLFIFMQKYFIKGIMAGSIKG